MSIEDRARWPLVSPAASSAQTKAESSRWENGAQSMPLDQYASFWHHRSCGDQMTPQWSCPCSTILLLTQASQSQESGPLCGQRDTMEAAEELWSLGENRHPDPKRRKVSVWPCIFWFTTCIFWLMGSWLVSSGWWDHDLYLLIDGIMTCIFWLMGSWLVSFGWWAYDLYLLVDGIMTCTFWLMGLWLVSSGWWDHDLCLLVDWIMTCIFWLIGSWLVSSGWWGHDDLYLLFDWCNKLHFVPRQSWALWPLLYSRCVAMALASFWLYLVFVSEVVVSSAIRNPQCRRIQRPALKTSAHDIWYYLRTTGRLTWLFYLELLWFFNEAQFSVRAVDFFLNHWNYVVSGTQISGWIFFVL